MLPHPYTRGGQVECNTGPPDGTASVYDDASGALLGSGPIGPGGDFKLKANVASAPHQVRVGVSSGTGMWTVGTLLVAGDGASCVLKPVTTTTKVKKKKRRKVRKKRKKKKRKRKKKKRSRR
ncbi:MAG: hypothetical protein JRH01_02780 [Deltaproteobacteria bacterium]|nr:hypothetical protein [Deltaproteobacteria bacterium]MBW2394375.1 hypothetical protein [Deltaproteobacteria bacterium]